MAASDTAGALGSQRITRSRPLGAISLAGNVGRLLIVGQSCNEELRVVAARLDLRRDPVRPGTEVHLGKYYTGLFGRLTESAAADGIANPGRVGWINATARKDHHRGRENHSCMAMQ